VTRYVFPLITLLTASSCTSFEPEPHSESSALVVRIDRADVPIADLPAPLLERFRAGDELFETVFREIDGLGPLYVRASCSDCHADDGRGPGFVTRVGRFDPGGSEKSLLAVLPFGDMERPYALGPAKPLLFSDGPGLRKTRRMPPAVFGRGYIEAVADRSILENAKRARRLGSPISGRVALLDQGPGNKPKIGRFGLKARSPDLLSFTADALQGDMGLTSSYRPFEPPNPSGVTDDAKAGLDVSDEQVGLLADYVRLLVLPERKLPRDPRGARLFAAVECNECHVPSLRTRSDAELPMLADIDAPIYSDLLLHDMGAELSDGIAERAAGPREWRTAPLMGMRFQSSFLHDGRAQSVEEAILLHQGEGSEAVDSVAAFLALDEVDRRLLLSFVQGL
jgi:CxxC motif-containing protein (DUF1111 family)